MAPPWTGRGAKGRAVAPPWVAEVQRAAQGRPGAGDQAVVRSSPELQHRVQHGALPARGGSSSCPELPPSPSQLGSSQDPGGSIPAVPWMEQEQDVSSSTEPVLLTRGFQHLELLGMSRSWAGRCGAALA